MASNFFLSLSLLVIVVGVNLSENPNQRLSVLALQDPINVCGKIGNPAYGNCTSLDSRTTYNCTCTGNPSVSVKRTCGGNGQYTPTLPVCPQIYAPDQAESTVDLSLFTTGTKNKALQSADFSPKIHLNLSTVKVWTNSSQCNELKFTINSDVDVKCADEGKPAHVLNVSHLITHEDEAFIRVNTSAHLVRVQLVAPPWAIQCGDPDLPPGMSASSTSKPSNQTVLSCPPGYVFSPSMSNATISSQCAGQEKWMPMPNSMKCIKPSPKSSGMGITILVVIVLIIIVVAVVVTVVVYLPRKRKGGKSSRRESSRRSSKLKANLADASKINGDTMQAEGEFSGQKQQSPSQAPPISMMGGESKEVIGQIVKDLSEMAPSKKRTKSNRKSTKKTMKTKTKSYLPSPTVSTVRPSKKSAKSSMKKKK